MTNGLAEGIITERDYVAAQFLHIRPRRALAIVGVLLVAAFIWTLVVAPSPLMFGIIAYLVVWFGLYIPWRAKRNYRQYKQISERISIEIREDGLFFSAKNGTNLVPWSHIFKWRQG